LSSREWIGGAFLRTRSSWEGHGLQQDQDVPPAKSAAGMVVFGLAAGLWARRSGILHARERQPEKRGRTRY
jgi:hypothetical protein